MNGVAPSTPIGHRQPTLRDLPPDVADKERRSTGSPSRIDVGPARSNGGHFALESAMDQQHGRDPWKYCFGMIGGLALSLLLLPPLPPSLRVIAIVIAGWAVLAGFNVLPRLHAGWRRGMS
jgi:hypothetical protein